MSNLHWTILVIAAFILATLVFWRKAKKDMFGAILGAVAIIVIAAILFTVTGCAVNPEYRPWLEAGIAKDRAQTVGSNPACVVRVRQPVWPGHVVAGFEHHSSCGDQDDRAEINQWEVMAIIPLGRERK